MHTTGSILPYWCLSSCSNSLHLQSPWRSKTVFPGIEHTVWDSSPAAGLQVRQQARVFYESKTRRKSRIAQPFSAPPSGCAHNWVGMWLNSSAGTQMKRARCVKEHSCVKLHGLFCLPCSKRENKDDCLQHHFSQSDFALQRVAGSQSYF